jgi:hypothetical protein
MADYRAQRLAKILADYERFTAHSNPMTDNNLIPPPELVNQWWDEAHQTAKYDEPIGLLVATRAAQWGADCELDACCEWLKLEGHEHEHEALFAARRPKPPSLKEEALAALDDAIMRGDCITISDALPTIRRALEALPE